MITVILIFLALALPCSFITIQKLSTINFCTLIGEDCIEKKCSYYEKCSSPFIYKCGQNKCARNASDCLLYLSAESHFNSRPYKINAKLASLPQVIEKTVRKQEVKFHKFQARVPICKHPVYVWNSSDVCLLSKVLFLN